MWKTIFPQLLGAAGSLPTRVLGCVHLTRVVVHFVNQDTNCFRIGVLVDAVAKVKDMAAIADLAALNYEVLNKVGDAVGKTQEYQL